MPVPVQLVYLGGTGRSKLELAGGVTIAHEDPANPGNWTNAHIPWGAIGFGGTF